MRLSRLVPLYAALVLTLAAMGVINQHRFDRQASLIDYKADLQSSIAGLRADAATIEGPLAVAAWARSRGMVPAPEVDAVRHVAYYSPPGPQSRPSGLEVSTVWR